MFLYRWMWNQQSSQVKEKRASDAASLQEQLKTILDAKDVKTRAERSYSEEELVQVDNRIRANVNEWKRYDIEVFDRCRQFLKKIDSAQCVGDRLTWMELALHFLSDKTDFLTINRYFARRLRSRFAAVYGCEPYQDVLLLYSKITQDTILGDGLIEFEMEQLEENPIKSELAEAALHNQQALIVLKSYDEKKQETDLVKQIQEMLRESEVSPRPKRLEITKEMFSLLAKNRWFMTKYPKFNKVVKDKFYEIIVTHGMTEFVPFYQPLFDEPFIFFP